MKEEIEYWILKGMLKDFVLENKSSTSAESKGQVEEANPLAKNKVSPSSEDPLTKIQIVPRNCVPGDYQQSKKCLALHLAKKEANSLKWWEKT